MCHNQRKIALYCAAIFCLSSIVLFIGCKPDIEIKLAPIHEVRVNIAESYPPQVFVYIQGGLSDGCTTFHEIAQDRDGNVITMKVTTQRPRDKVCTQAYGYFGKNVNLGTDFISGENYNIRVNDKMETFVMQ